MQQGFSVVPVVALATLPMQGAGFIGDHVYVACDAGLSWRCHGRNGGGIAVAQVAIQSAASCICHALPDQGAQPGMPSIGDADAGIRYAITGVCHQIAGRITVEFKPSFHAVRGYRATQSAFGPYGLGPWPELAACSGASGRLRISGMAPGVSRDRSPGGFGWTGLTGTSAMREDQGSFEENAVGQARDAAAGLAPGVIDAYDRFGYESPEARAAEVAALLDETLAERVDSQERSRVIVEHQRLHQRQGALLRLIDAGDLDPDTALEAMTEERVAFFRQCEAILGNDRFATLFGDDLETTVAQFEGLPRARAQGTLE